MLPSVSGFTVCFKKYKYANYDFSPYSQVMFKLAPPPERKAYIGSETGRRFLKSVVTFLYIFSIYTEIFVIHLFKDLRCDPLAKSKLFVVSVHP